MRIAFISVSDQLGGSEAMLLQIADGIGRTRPAWERHLILPGGGPLADAARRAGLQVAMLPMPRSLARLGESGLAGAGRGTAAARLARAAIEVPGYARALGALLARLDPSVIHTNGFKAHVLGARAAAPGRRLVWHLHEYISGRPLTSRLLRLHASRCSVVVANSASVASDARAVLGARADIRVIYNAVDLERFAPAGPAADLDALAGWSPAAAGTIRVGLVATFSRWKGHETFLRAVAALPRSLPIRAYVIGGAVYDTDGSQHSTADLRRLAERLGIGDRVGFTGFVRDADQVMRALDVVVHASTTPEPFGLVIAEAMACGRALVMSEAGGAAELIRPGIDALTHQPGDAQGLAGAVGLLAADPGRRAALGRAAREAASARFDVRRLAVEIADVYEPGVRAVVPA